MRESQNHLSQKVIALTLLLLTAAGATGCQSWFGKKKDGNKFNPWPLSQFAKGYQTPQRMAAIWTDDVMSMPGRAPERGFGGRIYFYNEMSIPVPVEGDLVVYGYEEDINGKGPKKDVPDRKFEFKSEQFTKQFSESDLGASYSVWLPWDAVGGYGKRVTLMPAFKSKDGQVVRGETVELTLPGRARETAEVFQVGAPGSTPNMAAQPPAVPPTTGFAPAKFSTYPTSYNQVDNGMQVAAAQQAAYTSQSPVVQGNFNGVAQQAQAANFLQSSGPPSGNRRPSTTIQVPSSTARGMRTSNVMPMQPPPMNQPNASMLESMPPRPGTTTSTTGSSVYTERAPTNRRTPAVSSATTMRGVAFPGAEGNPGIQPGYAPQSFGGMQEPAHGAQPQYSGVSQANFQTGFNGPAQSISRGMNGPVATGLGPNPEPVTYFYQSGDSNPHGTILSGTPPTQQTR